MNTKDLVQFLQKESRQLVSGLMPELRSNLGTSHYRRLSDSELFQRVEAVYSHLAQWVAAKSETAIRKDGEELGKRRFMEGIPLGQVVLALVLTEKQLLQYPKPSPLAGDLPATIEEFFQKIIYHASHGYEVALAESNLRSHRETVGGKVGAGVVAPSPTHVEAPKETDEEVSRGGQVGEFGG